MNKSGTILVFMLSPLGVTVYQPDGLLRPILLVVLNYNLLHHLVIAVDQFAICTTKTCNGKTVCMQSEITRHLMQHYRFASELRLFSWSHIVERK